MVSRAKIKGHKDFDDLSTYLLCNDNDNNKSDDSQPQKNNIATIAEVEEKLSQLNNQLTKANLVSINIEMLANKQKETGSYMFKVFLIFGLGIFNANVTNLIKLLIL